MNNTERIQRLSDRNAALSRQLDELHKMAMDAVRDTDLQIQRANKAEALAATLLEALKIAEAYVADGLKFYRAEKIPDVLLGKDIECLETLRAAIAAAETNHVR